MLRFLQLVSLHYNLLDIYFYNQCNLSADSVEYEYLLYHWPAESKIAESSTSTSGGWSFETISV